MTDMVKTRSALDIAGKRLRIETLAVSKEATESVEKNGESILLRKFKD